MPAKEKWILFVPSIMLGFFVMRLLEQEQMKQTKLITISVIVAVILIGAFLWQKKFSGKQPVTPQLTPVTLALDWTPNTDHTGIYVAQAKGWYKKQGINLKILPFSSDVSATTLVTNGKTDIGIGSMEDIVGNAARKHPVVSIGAVLQHNTSGFIATDPQIKSPKDFDGKLYGGYGSPFEDAVVREVIKKDGGQGNFKDIVLSVDAMQALESKRIDFVWVLAGWEVIQAKRSGLAYTFFPITQYGIPDSPTLAFIVTPKKIKEDPRLLKQFMTATAQGYEYARQHPKEAAQILISTAPKGTFPDTQFVFDSQAVVSREYADPNRKWGIQDNASWQGYPQFMLDSGAILDASGKPVSTMDFHSLYTNQFLP